ncbi:tetratricopeptide repeat protein [Bradyrhizobium jicamae]|uniref:Tetratricopeptide repeat protein n=1 Tax=Bradyrhizobium jicamae TaxID=280332 RepID=A0ABS5FXM0_9BRAD|nr:adenylate/guanylate cyclase domain-containing protein [Bradyrhizobium jicamae]MBR0801569.1 tetratricopeptide repeat protein [Bradyrhizobium jicamae]
MSNDRVRRRLAAVLAADVVGYSRLMGRDEEGTLARLKALRSTLVDPKIVERGGRIVKTTGDGMLVEFPSIVDALCCAVEVQRAMAEQNAEVPQESRIEFRVGVNLGDIITDGEDIHGDGVNIAARLESLAEPGGVCVSQTVVNHVRGKVPFDVRDGGEQVLKNIARPVHVFHIITAASRRDIGSEATTSTPALPDKPSIAVLPFQNMSGDPEQDYFADGMVEEIITALSRIKWLFVIARNSSFTYKGRTVDVKQVGRELGVRYVLEGSIRKAGNRVRITGQLIDAISGAHLWAEHFDGLLEDVFDLQDQVAISVSGVIEPTLQAAEIRRSENRPTNDLAAYDLYLRSVALTFAWERTSVIRAVDLLEQAIKRDPGYGPALALEAMCYQNLHINGWSENQEADRQLSIDFARRAVRVAGDDPIVLSTAAHALGYFEENIHPAIALIDRALELNPSSATSWYRSGTLRLWAGQPELAIQHFEASLRLNPRRGGPGLFGIGLGHFFARRFDRAVELLLQSLQVNPNWGPTYRFLASCYAHMGRLDEARKMIECLRTITPIVVPSVASHWRRAEDRALYFDGLRLAVGE